MRGAAAIITGIILAVVALIHLARLLCPFEVIIGSYHVPMWASMVFFLVAGLLSAWLFRPEAV